MKTRIEYNENVHIIFAQLINEETNDGDILPGMASDDDIRAYAEKNWRSPLEKDAEAKYSDVTIIWMQ